MTVIVCLSDGGGMTFNKRRQSRDAVVTEDIAKLVGDGMLFISDFSLNLFSDSSLSVIAASDPLSVAADDDFVFLEDRCASQYREKIRKLVVYKWNRKYPTDFKFDIEPALFGFHIAATVEFPGKSHEKITREIWVR